jgi:hypothetical protein
MLIQHPMRPVRSLVPGLVVAIVFACACSGPGPESEAVDGLDAASAEDSQGLPTKGDDGGLGTKGDDSGLGTKGDDGGLGTKGDDSGLGTMDDGGSGTEDAGSGTEDAGMPGAEDAGEVNECLACAEKRCALQVNACLQSPACVEEGNCDLTCLTGSAGPFGAPDPHCVQSCTKDPRAAEELLAALTCGFSVCPRECLRPLISCGGDAGAPVEVGCPLRRSGGVPR